VSTQAVSHGHPDSRVKPNLTVYDKSLCKNKSPLTVSDDQLPAGVEWENVEFSFPAIPNKPFPFNYCETRLAIPIPTGIPWDPWEFSI